MSKELDKVNAPTEKKSPLFADPSLPLAVVVTTSSWDEPPRMRHHIGKQLQRWFNVMYVTVGNEESTTLGTVLGGRLVRVVVPRLKGASQRSYSYNPIVHHRVNKRCAKEIERHVTGFPPGPVLLFNFMWDFPELLDLGCWDYRVYVCCDEFPGMWRNRRIKGSLPFEYRKRLGQRYEDGVARRADLCLTPHAALRDKLGKNCRNTRLLYHANDFMPDASLIGPRRSIDSDGAIRVAFMGYIHYRLLDDWLKRVVMEKDMELNLIGPLHPDYRLEEIGRADQWTHHGTVVGDELEQLLGTMDVLVMPYDPVIPEVRILTSASKLFQYIGTLKPVVVSDLPDLLEFREGVIYRASDPSKFIGQIRRAVTEDGKEFRKARMKTAIENSWDKRGDELIELLEPVIRSLDIAVSHDS